MQANTNQDLPQYSRTPPSALDLEEAVLSSILVDRQSILSVASILKPDHFYDPSHALIYEAMLSLFRGSQPIDLLTVVDRLKRSDHLDDVGGPAALAALSTKVTSSANVEYHAVLVLDRAVRRQIISTSTEAITNAYDDVIDTPVLLGMVESSIYTLASGIARKQIRSLEEVGVDRFDWFSKIKEIPEGETIGLTSGLTSVDEWTGGFRAAEFTIVAARPAMGKTSFILTMARNQAVLRGIPVGVLSLEMSDEQLYDRFWSQESGVPVSKIRDPRSCSEEEWIRLTDAQNRLDLAPIYIDDTEGLSVVELRAKGREMIRKGIKVLYIDYLQLCEGGNDSARRSYNREQEISQISRACKSMTKELGIPVIALSQLSRAVETRGGDKRPQLSDLRESGSLEQDADCVMFLYRPEYYNIYEDEHGNSLRGITELIIGKNRNGPVGTAELKFVDYKAQFMDLDPDFDIPDDKPYTGEIPKSEQLSMKIDSDEKIPF